MQRLDLTQATVFVLRDQPSQICFFWLDTRVGTYIVFCPTLLMRMMVEVEIENSQGGDEIQTAEFQSCVVGDGR